MEYFNFPDLGVLPC